MIVEIVTSREFQKLEFLRINYLKWKKNGGDMLDQSHCAYIECVSQNSRDHSDVRALL